MYPDYVPDIWVKDVTDLKAGNANLPRKYAEKKRKKRQKAGWHIREVEEMEELEERKASGYL